MHFQGGGRVFNRQGPALYLFEGSFEHVGPVAKDASWANIIVVAKQASIPHQAIGHEGQQSGWMIGERRFDYPARAEAAKHLNELIACGID